jgi:hypothetical protein
VAISPYDLTRGIITWRFKLTRRAEQRLGQCGPCGLAITCTALLILGKRQSDRSRG